MKTSIIKLENVTKSFNRNEQTFTALSDLNLEIKKGEILAIVGKSGSGKSTLLNMITGIDYPSRGAVIVNGENLKDMNESQLAAWRGRNIGIVFQFFQLIPTLTILENLLLAMEFVNEIPAGEQRKRALDLLELVGIAEQAHKMPAALSGGEQQRAAIARALANDPEILVADEPTGNLDSKTAAAIQSLFTNLAGTGKTIIIVTHETDLGSRYERVINLSDGKITHKTKPRKEASVR